jgi:hypothetical protein
MAPVALSKVDQSSPVLFHPKALTERPKLAPLVARAIAGWSEIEGQMGTLIVNMLGANAAPTLAMFSALNSASTQIEALKAAATSVLDPDRKQVFDAAFSLAKTSSRARNHLAHRIWGYSEALPDALLLIESEHRSKHLMKTRTEFQLFKQGLPSGSIDWPRDKILVYTDSDLIQIIADMDALYEIFYNLSFLAAGGYPEPQRLLDYLRAELRLS